MVVAQVLNGLVLIYILKDVDVMHAGETYNKKSNIRGINENFTGCL